MASQELVRTLDYILNRCNEQEIEAVAAAIVRRRRDIAMFGSMPVAPDPRRLAETISAQFNIDESIEGIKTGIRDYAIGIIKQQAPELTDAQVEVLTRSWIPETRTSPGGKKRADSSSQEQSLPADLLHSMINQFVSFSLGRMEEEDDRALRRDIGPWPDKYWKAFPQVVRLLVTDYLKGEINENEFNTRIGMALKL